MPSVVKYPQIRSTRGGITLKEVNSESSVCGKCEEVLRVCELFTESVREAHRKLAGSTGEVRGKYAGVKYPCREYARGNFRALPCASH